LVTRFEVVTDDPEVADASLQRAYVDFRRRLGGDDAGFTFRFRGVRADGFSVAEMHHGMGFDCESEPIEQAIVLSEVLSGRVEMSTRDVVLDPAVNEPYLVTPYERWRVRWEECTGAPIGLDQVTVDRAAAGLGWSGGEVRFTGHTAISPAAARYTRAVTRFVRAGLIDTDDLAVSDLLLAETARSLAVAALTTFPSTALDVLLGAAPRTPAGSEPPAVVRRAMEFMDANAHRTIGPEDTAAAARVGVRALQAAFRRHRDESPTDYLRGVRMERAHAELVAGDPTRGDRVGAIAARWGFGNPGRFSVLYRRAYGRSPGETLRR
jgi:AraC-like DNA-binding protein